MRISRTNAKAALGRLREQYRQRPGHQPDESDTLVWNFLRPVTVWARPNFYYFSSLGNGRPAWLPLYPYPRMQKGLALNAYNDGRDPWPLEGGLGTKPDDDHWVQVVGWHRVLGASREDGSLLNNEHVLGGWLRGDFEASSLWLLVVVPRKCIADNRLDANPVHYSKRFDGYLAWANSLWLGNRAKLSEQLPGVRADAAQHPPGGFE